MRLRMLLVLAVLGALLVPAGLALARPSERPLGAQLAELRQATVAYQDLAAAEADGYVLQDDCVPHMGYHAVRGNPFLAAEDLDPLDPNILVYAPSPGGELRLVAVEWSVDPGDLDDATLYGQTFDPPGDPGPPFGTLHAWIWQANPDGTFAAHNRNIRC
jgi:hypothetical protein